MKPKFIALYLIVFMVGFVGFAEVKNQDKSQNGIWDFAMQKQWQTDTAGEDILVSGRVVRLSKEGNIFILEAGQRKVHVFRPHNGKHLLSIGKKGEGPGEIKDAYTFFLFEDDVIVPDMGKYHYFSNLGEYIQTISVEGMFIDFLYLDLYTSVRTSFHATAMGEKNRLVESYNSKTKETKELMRMPAKKNVRYSDKRMAMILRIPNASAGGVMEYDGKFIYYGWSDDYIIKKIDLKGKELLTFSIPDRKKQVISDGTKRDILTKQMITNRKLDKATENKMIKQFPDEAPFFHEIHVDESGFIYIIAYELENRAKRNIDIFSNDGNYLWRGSLQLGDNEAIISNLAFNSNHLALFVEDEEGERGLRYYKINLPKPN